MKRYLELARIARALKAETWQSGAETGAHGDEGSGDGATAFVGPGRSPAGLALATTTAGPP